MKQTAPDEQQGIEESFKAIAQEEERVVEAYRLKILSPEQLARELEKLNARRGSLESRKSDISGRSKIAAEPEIKRSLTGTDLSMQMSSRLPTCVAAL